MGGVHLHYDEIISGSERGTYQKVFRRALLRALTEKLKRTSARRSQGSDPAAEELQDRSMGETPDKLAMRVAYVDRTNILKNQREDITAVLQRLQWKKRDCRTLLVDFRHSTDVFGHGADGQFSKRFGKSHIALCTDRIEGRGVAHHALRPSAKLPHVLQKEACAAQPLSPEELQHVDSQLTLDVADSPVQNTLTVVEELKRLGWLTLAMDPRALALKVELEWQVYNKAQAAWRLQASDGKERHEWLEQCRQAAQEQKAAGEAAEAIRQAKRATWRFDIPEVRQVLMEKSILPSGFETASHTMVDLLTLPDENEGAAKEKLEAMIDALEALHGESLEVRMTKIFISETTACALVALPPVLADMGKVPHVFLGKRRGATAASIEELLKEAEDGKVTCIPVQDPRPMTGRVVLESGP